MEIKREEYLEQLIASQGNGMIKVITGIRRCGKSYLLNKIFYNYLVDSGVDASRIIRFSFDSAKHLIMIGENPLILDDLKAKVDPKKFMTYIDSHISHDKTFYLLLDEIQLLGAFESVLNSYLSENNIEIYVTGSNAKFLSKDVITEFRGRGWQIRVSPLSFKEYYESVNEDKWEALHKYMTYGGLPALLNMDDNDKESYLKSLYIETYLKDIVMRNRINDERLMDSLISVISSSVGSLTNPLKLEHSFRSIAKISISSPTISKYIDYLNDAFIISISKRYDIRGKQYLNTPFKCYFTDLGLRNASMNFRQVESTHLLENLIYNELLLRGYSVDVGSVEKQELVNGKYKRVQNEVDFVCNLKDCKIYIQVAYSIPDKEKLNQEQKSLLAIKDSFKKVIITADGLFRPHYNEDGILMMNVFDFLLDKKSIFH